MVKALLKGLLGCLLIALTSCSPNLQEPITRFELQAPKPYGYVIGDEIRHRIVIETRKHIDISADSIPARGERNRWLNLKAVDISSETSGDGKRYLLDLTYQIFYSPLEVKMLLIPGFNLVFQQYGQRIEQVVPDWHFTLSPLHELSIRKENGKMYLRPDAQPEFINTNSYRQAFFIRLLALALSCAYLAYSYGLFPWFSQRNNFKKACKDLSGLSRQQLDQALRVFHQAINAVNQQPLFKQGLTDFYLRQPEYKTMAAELDWFFALSERYFFDGRTYCTEDEFEQLKALCQHCRKIERGRL